MQENTKKVEAQQKAAEERSKLRAQLQWGDLEKIVKIAGVGRSTVERWFDGKTDNSSVRECVEKLIERRKKQIDSRLNDQL